MLAHDISRTHVIATKPPDSPAVARSLTEFDALRWLSVPRIPHSVIVEFSGTPGVGKSYIADRLLAELQARGHDAHDGLKMVAATLPSRTRAVRKIRVAAVELVRSPVEASRIVRALMASGQPPKDLVKLAQNWLVVRSTMRSARRFGGIHLFDQGVIQQLCSIGFRGDWHPCLNRALPGRGRLGPDVIVRVTAPVALNAERLDTRSAHHSRVEGLSADQRLAELAKQDASLTEIEDHWTEQATLTTPVRRVAVSNDGALSPATIGLLIASIAGSAP